VSWAFAFSNSILVWRLDALSGLAVRNRLGFDPLELGLYFPSEAGYAILSYHFAINSLVICHPMRTPHLSKYSTDFGGRDFPEISSIVNSNDYGRCVLDTRDTAVDIAGCRSFLLNVHFIDLL